MKAALRNISVTVVELGDGRFRWQLLEQDASGDWALLEEGTGDIARYAPAMAAGLVRLEQLVDDLSQGPRQQEARGPRRDPGAVDARRGSDAPAAEVPHPARGKLFGFGPLR